MSLHSTPLALLLAVIPVLAASEASATPRTELGISFSNPYTRWHEYQPAHYYEEEWSLLGVGYAIEEQLFDQFSFPIYGTGTFDFFPLATWKNWREDSGSAIAARAAGSLEVKVPLHQKVEFHLGLNAGFTWSLGMKSSKDRLPYQEAFTISLLTLSPTGTLQFSLPQWSPFPTIGFEARIGLVELAIFTNNMIETAPSIDKWTDHQFTMWLSL